jgi:hypothetical protein
VTRLERLAEIYNYVEVALWTALAFAVALYGWRRPARRARCLLGASALLAFAGSDFVEARTGNQWWRPWWLLAWKALCIAVLGGLVVSSWIDRRRAPVTETGRSEDRPAD